MGLLMGLLDTLFKALLKALLMVLLMVFPKGSQPTSVIPEVGASRYDN
jgi:hypothetical protein